MNNGWPVVIVIALFVLSLVVAMLPPVRRALIGEDEPRDLRNLGREHLPALRFGEIEVRLFQFSRPGDQQTIWTAIFYRQGVKVRTATIYTQPHLLSVGRAKEWVRTYIPELTLLDEIASAEERLSRT